MIYTNYDHSLDQNHLSQSTLPPIEINPSKEEKKEALSDSPPQIHLIVQEALGKKEEQELNMSSPNNLSSTSIKEIDSKTPTRAKNTGININNFAVIHKTGFTQSDEGPKNKSLVHGNIKDKGRRSSENTCNFLGNSNSLKVDDNDAESVRKNISPRKHSPKSKNSSPRSPNISPGHSPLHSPKHSPKQQFHSNYQISPRKTNNKSISVLLPKEVVVGYDDLNKYREARPLNLKDFEWSLKKKFDKIIFTKLTEIVKNVPLYSAESIQNHAFNFCLETIKNLFKNDYTIDKYVKYGYDRIELMLSIIQNGGLLVKDFIPQLVLMRNALTNYIMEQKEKTKFTEDLYTYLQELTRIDKLNIKEESWGKNLADFLNVVDRVSDLGRIKNLQEINNPIKDSKSKCMTYNPYKLRDLILQAIGGQVSGESPKEISNDNSINIINALKLWAKPNEGEHPPIFKTFQSYCNRIAMLCAEVNNLKNVEYQCFIKHFNQEITPKLDPNPIFTIKWERLYPSSYSAHAINEIFSNLFKKFSANKITVNDLTFFDGNLQTNFLAENSFGWKKIDSDPALNFLSNFSECCSNNGFLAIKSSLVEKHARELKRYHDHPDEWLQRSNSFRPVILEDEFPILKITELMTEKCMNVAIGYLNLLFPVFFTENGSPYYVNLRETVLEHQIKIQNENDFSVTQMSEFDICLKGISQKILATVSFSWKNELTPTSSQVPGWNGVLKINCKVHNLDYWESIMDHLIRPNRPSGSPGLHYNREINDLSERKEFKTHQDRLKNLKQS